MKLNNPQPIKKEIPDISEPQSQNILKKFKDEISSLWKNPVTKWSTIAGSFRFFEAFTLIYFIPSFYLKVFPEKKAEFALYYAILVGFGGTISNMAGGLIADARKDKNPLIYS